MKLYFILLRSLSLSPEVAKDLMKQKTIEEMLVKIQPVCKNEKDIKQMKSYLYRFSAFIAAYSQSEDGQKIILVISTFHNCHRNLINSMNLYSSSWIPLPLSKFRLRITNH